MSKDIGGRFSRLAPTSETPPNDGRTRGWWGWARTPLSVVGVWAAASNRTDLAVGTQVLLIVGDRVFGGVAR